MTNLDEEVHGISFYDYIDRHNNSDSEQKIKAQELHTLVESNAELFWKNGASLIKPLFSNTVARGKVLEKLEFHIFILEQKEVPIEGRDVDNIRLYYNDFGGHEDPLHFYYLPNEEKKLSNQKEEKKKPSIAIQRLEALEKLIDDKGLEKLQSFGRKRVHTMLVELNLKDDKGSPLFNRDNKEYDNVFRNRDLINFPLGTRRQ